MKKADYFPGENIEEKKKALPGRHASKGRSWALNAFLFSVDVKKRNHGGVQYKSRS